MEKSVEALLRGGQLKHLLDKKYHELCQQYELKRVDVEILLAINALGNHVAPIDLMHFLSINKGYVSQSIFRMKEHGYLNVITDSHNRRYHRVNLTEKGLELSSIIEAKQKEICSLMFQGISKNDYECFLRVIGQISNNIEDILSK